MKLVRLGLPRVVLDPRAVPTLIGALLIMAAIGCGSGPLTRSLPGVALQGRVHGGQQPVTGSSISLYAAGTAGNGAGAVDLLLPHRITTDAAGNFDITADYTCPTSTTQVYLVAHGGNPGLVSGAQNPALSLMAALGDCGSLTPSTTIFVDEVTTVAAAWSLSPFFGSNALAGAPASNAAGLRNAFANAALIANNASGMAPGPALPKGSSTETAKIYSLADAIASCVNSDGGNACTPLFQAATVNGIAPSTTFDAALNIVRNPGANVTAVYQLITASAPFQPALARAPNDWTLSIKHGNCASGCGGLNLPGTLALDSTGNVWVANYFGAILSKFSPQGAPLAPDGFPGVGLKQSYSVVIDPYDNAWVANQQSTTAAGNSRHGSVSKFTSAGAEVSANGFTGGGIYYPQALAAAANGTLWVANYAGSSATLLANDGTALSPSGGSASSLLPFPSAVALDSASNAWFTDQTGVARVSPAGAVNTFSCCNGPEGLALDQGGNIWVANYGGYNVVKLSPAGQVQATVSTAASLVSPLAVAIDGVGNVWAANYYGNSITSINGATATLSSPTAGLGLDAALNEPYWIAVDASGDLWLSNSGENSITVLLGLASPVKTPNFGPPMQP